MQNQRTVSFRIEQEKVAALDAIAKAMDRDRSYLLNQAVEGYLIEQKQFIALIEEGLEASREGRLIEDEDVARWMDSWTGEKTTGEKASLEKK
jgi:predicted transcriptional regulator